MCVCVCVFLWYIINFLTDSFLFVCNVCVCAFVGYYKFFNRLFLCVCVLLWDIINFLTDSFCVCVCVCVLFDCEFLSFAASE